MTALKGHNMLLLKKMEVRVSSLTMEMAKKLARGNVNQMKIAKMRESFAFVMAPVACHVLDQKRNVLNYLTHLMGKSISQDGNYLLLI